MARRWERSIWTHGTWTSTPGVLEQVAAVKFKGLYVLRPGPREAFRRCPVLLLERRHPKGGVVGRVRVGGPRDRWHHGKSGWGRLQRPRGPSQPRGSRGLKPHSYASERAGGCSWSSDTCGRPVQSLIQNPGNGQFGLPPAVPAPLLL